MKTENTAGKINLLLTEQFAIDYGCTVEDFCSKETWSQNCAPMIGHESVRNWVFCPCCPFTESW